MRPHKVGEADHFFLLRCCCVVLVRWFLFRRDACVVLFVLLLPFPILASSCPFIFPSIHPCLKWVLPLSGLMSPEFLQKYRAAAISCAAWLYFVSGETYCQGRWVGWLEDNSYPVGCFSVFLFLIVKKEF